MSVECQVNVKSQSELDIGGRETCSLLNTFNVSLFAWTLKRVKLTNQIITIGIRDQLSR